jgi:hypothetical protein
LFQATLGPGEERVIVAWGVFSRPGVYDVNRWRMSVELICGEGVLGVVYGQTPTVAQNLLIVGK